MAKKKCNRVAVALIVNGDDKVLMGKRSDSGKFTLPGGHAEFGEDIHESMIRELKEETGLDSKNMKLVLVRKDPISGKLIYLFRVEVDSEQQIDVSGDPDSECPGWHYEDPLNHIDNLHVPIHRNLAVEYWANN